MQKPVNLNTDMLDTVRTGGIASAGVTYSFLGMPFSEAAALATLIYVVIKIIMLLPDLIKKFSRNKDESD